MDKVVKKLEKLQHNARSLSGTRQIPSRELFTPEFMARHSKVPTFEALIAAGGHSVKTKEDFKAIPDDQWEQTVRAHTSFNSWHEMQATAVREYYARRLKSGL